MKKTFNFLVLVAWWDSNTCDKMLRVGEGARMAEKELEKRSIPWTWLPTCQVGIWHCLRDSVTVPCNTTPRRSNRITVHKI